MRTQACARAHTHTHTRARTHSVTYGRSLLLTSALAHTPDSSVLRLELLLVGPNSFQLFLLYNLCAEITSHHDTLKQIS